MSASSTNASAVWLRAAHSRWLMESRLLESLYTVSQKKLCQLIFCSLSARYEPISIKIGRIVPEETLNKTVPKLPTLPWEIWSVITVSYVCCYSVNHSNGDKCTLNYCVDGSIWHLKFPKVVQAHTLGEVGTLPIVLLQVSSGIILQFLLNSVHIWQTRSKK